jgi:hypothetical protein
VGDANAVLTAVSLAAAALPGLTGIGCAAVIIGAGCGIITPLAFTTLAQSTPHEHLGQTMGAAEIGRECGDAAGPLIVAAIAASTTLPLGYLGLTAIIATPQLAKLVTAATSRRR